MTHEAFLVLHCAFTIFHVSTASAECILGLPEGSEHRAPPVMVYCTCIGLLCCVDESHCIRFCRKWRLIGVGYLHAGLALRVMGKGESSTSSGMSSVSSLCLKADYCAWR